MPKEVGDIDNLKNQKELTVEQSPITMVESPIFQTHRKSQVAISQSQQTEEQYLSPKISCNRLNETNPLQSILANNNPRPILKNRTLHLRQSESNGLNQKITKIRIRQQEANQMKLNRFRKSNEFAS